MSRTGDVRETVKKEKSKERNECRRRLALHDANIEIGRSAEHYRFKKQEIIKREENRHAQRGNEA